jgi:hypothetical protein
LILFLDKIQTAPEVLAKLRWNARGGGGGCNAISSRLIETTLPNILAAWSHGSWTMSCAVLSINWAINEGLA